MRSRKIFPVFFPDQIAQSAAFLPQKELCVALHGPNGGFGFGSLVWGYGGHRLRYVQISRKILKTCLLCLPAPLAGGQTHKIRSLQGVSGVAISISEHTSAPIHRCGGIDCFPATLRLRLKANCARPVRNYISNGARNDTMEGIFLQS